MPEGRREEEGREGCIRDSLGVTDTRFGVMVVEEVSADEETIGDRTCSTMAEASHSAAV